jgi:FAD/FMN-containing dehydrogenase
MPSSAQDASNLGASTVTPKRINASFSQQAVDELGQGLVGSVVLPADPSYDACRQAYIKTYQQFPQIIVYCEIYRDVALALAFAKKYGLEVTCRSGGHNTAGYSVNSGLIIDLSRMNHVSVNPGEMQATAGVGASFEKINAVLDQYHLHAPGAGGCAHVCAGGYVQGGGYGFTSLMYGMSSDNIVRMVVALADGSIVQADKQTNYPLFWALRGGTGNNFGVVLEVTFQLQNLWEVWGFGIRWDIESAPAALVAMQRGFTGDATPAKLGYQCLMEWVDVDGSKERQPVLQMRGMYDGSEADGRKALSAMLATKGAVLEISKPDTYESLNNFLLFEHTEAARLPAQVREEVDSRYVCAALEEKQWREVTEAFKNSPNDGNLIGLEPYGGRITKIAPHDTAFVHRTPGFNLYCWVMWLNEEERGPAIAFLDGLMAIVSKFSNDEANQNYPRRSNTNYRSMYWAGNYSTLLAIKRKYDPHNFFSYGHCVSHPASPAEQKLLFDINAPIVSLEHFHGGR